MHNTESNTAYFQCSCSSEMLSIEKFTDEPEIYMSIWYRGAQAPMRWRDKIRYCWRIITEGSPYGDQLVLDKDTAALVSAHIHKLLD